MAEMVKTRQAARVIDLLRATGCQGVTQLVFDAQDIARERHSAVLGFRHLLIAAGIPWSGPHAEARRRESGR